MHFFCKYFVLFSAAFSFGVFLGKRNPRPAGSAINFLHSFGLRQEHNDHIFKHNLNNFLEDAKQDLDWTTADASDEKIGQNSFQLGQVRQETTSLASTRFHRLLLAAFKAFKASQDFIVKSLHPLALMARGGESLAPASTYSLSLESSYSGGTLGLTTTTTAEELPRLTC